MQYPDFKWVDVAKDGWWNRNLLCDITKLGDPTGLVETYMTYFRYPDEMKQYFDTNIVTSKKTGHRHKSVEGYTGTAYTDWIPIDIDSQDLQTSLDNAIRFIERMELYSIDTNACRYYFSGKKGFHIMIPSQMTQITPREDIHKRLRHVATSLAGDVPIDTTVYDKVRIFRLPNTKHGKSGLYKIELYEFELRTMSPEQILALAREPRETLEIEEEFDSNDYLCELYETYQEQTHVNTSGTTDGVKVKLCMKTIMEGIPEGSRDNAGLRVVTHLKQAGLSRKMIWVAFNEWSESCDPPLETHEVERIFEQGMKSYDFGCRDPIKQAYCSKECLLFKEEYLINNVSRRL
jgi:hypothetical protein